MISYKKKLLFFTVFTIVFLAGFGFAKAANVGDIVNFNVDSGYDASARTQTQATLIDIGNNLYFYVETDWWTMQTQSEQQKVLTNLNNLSQEFSNNIYPNLTSQFGHEWTPGIDNDTKITVLLESMNSTDGGYFREDDEYDKLQVPDSNQREMVYLALSSADDLNQMKIILAHEFMHLIIFNQQNKINGVEEDTWLNEGISDYTATFLGYDTSYSGSNLEARVDDFINDPTDSLTDFQNSKYDFATANLFVQYLVDHYGVNILSDAIKSKYAGIAGINYALQENGFSDTFAQIFTNWTIALAINDCSQNKEYCYLNKNLSSLRIDPTLIFLPLSGSSSLSSTNVTKNWSGNWQKIIGGTGNLKLDFSSSAGLNFEVPYIVYDKDNNYTVNFLNLDSNEKGEISIKDFGTKYNSLIVIPSLQTKTSGFSMPDLLFPYTFTVSITGDASEADQLQIQQLLSQIDSVQKQITALQMQKNINLGQACKQFNTNLYYGISNQVDVECLQSFLKNQGATIYSEGLITGNFGSLTKQAVENFQKKYSIPQTGYVGSLTRAEINKLLNGQ